MKVLLQSFTHLPLGQAGAPAVRCPARALAHPMDTGHFHECATLQRFKHWHFFRCPSAIQCCWDLPWGSDKGPYYKPVKSRATCLVFVLSGFTLGCEMITFGGLIT